MAQKKVILQDGQNDLMPKTLASVVFTEDGTSVETALKNLGSGGGSSGGGTGNVKVTNASGLNKVNYYAFKPSANGSVEGTFRTVPLAGADRNGLMGSNDKTKLDDIKDLNKFPLAVASLTNSSSSEEILQAIGVESSQANGLLYMMLILSNAEVNEYNSDYPQVFIGNTPANMRCTYDSEAASGTMELTYVAAGGKLRTITISGKQGGASPDYTYTYSCAVTESGDDTYYLPETICNLSSNSTSEEIKDILTKERNTEIRGAVKAGKKLYFAFTSFGLIPKCIPVSYMGFTYTALSWIEVSNTENPIVKYVYSPDSSDQTAFVREFYLDGYSLNPELDSLTSSSDTDAISIAVGGESGLKAIIQAVKDGNRLVLKSTGENGVTSLAYIISAIYAVSDNGDMSLALGFDVYAIIGFNRIGIAINYTKSSNTFTCNKTTV